MLVCPDCKTSLTHIRTPLGPVYVCSTCHGRAVTFATLAKSARADFLRRLRSKSEAPPRKGRPCPSCEGPMAVADFPVTGGQFDLDACSRCQLVWAEAQELAELPPLMPARRPPPARAPDRLPGPAAPPGALPPPQPPALPSPGPRAGAPPAQRGAKPAARPAPGTAPPRPVRAQPVPAVIPKPPPPAPVPAVIAAPSLPAEDEIRDGPISPWKYLPAILGLPVQLGVPAVRGAAGLTWTIGAVCSGLFVFLLLHNGLEAAVRDWGYVPNQWRRHYGLTILTSMFLHGGPWHLIANMYFLLIFGRSVEDRLGAVRYLLLLLLSHAAGMAVHGFDPRGDMPAVGASAAISGVIAYYAILFPYARIGFMIRIFLLFGPWVRVPAYQALVLFVAAQIAGTVLQLMGFSGVSYLGHLGGLGVGILAGLWARLGRREAAYA